MAHGLDWRWQGSPVECLGEESGWASSRRSLCIWAGVDQACAVWGVWPVSPEAASGWRRPEVGLPWGWRADSGRLCFPRREYTEDGQVKTERKYSYSESRAPPCSPQPLSFLSQHQAPCVLVLGALLPPSIQRGSRSSGGPGLG